MAQVYAMVFAWTLTAALFASHMPLGDALNSMHPGTADAIKKKHMELNIGSSGGFNEIVARSRQSTNIMKHTNGSILEQKPGGSDYEKNWQVIKIQEICKKQENWGVCWSQQSPQQAFNLIPEDTVAKIMQMKIDSPSNDKKKEDKVASGGGGGGVVASGGGGGGGGVSITPLRLLQEGSSCGDVEQCLQQASEDDSACGKFYGQADARGVCSTPTISGDCEQAVDQCKQMDASAGKVCWRQALCCQPTICNSWKADSTNCQGAYCATSSETRALSMLAESPGHNISGKTDSVSKVTTPRARSLASKRISDDSGSDSLGSIDTASVGKCSG